MYHTFFIYLTIFVFGNHLNYQTRAHTHLAIITTKNPSPQNIGLTFKYLKKKRKHFIRNTNAQWNINVLTIVLPILLSFYYIFVFYFLVAFFYN